MTVAAKRKKTRKKKATKKRGRPKAEFAEASRPASRCVNRKCRSTNRSPYWGRTQVQRFVAFQCDSCGDRFDKREGVECSRAGCPGRCVLPFNRILWRRCNCLDCGQVRVDRTFEWDPKQAQQSG